MNTVWVQIAEDIVQLHHFVNDSTLYQLIDGSINVPRGATGMRFPLGSLDAYTYETQVAELKEWLSDRIKLSDDGWPTLSVRLDLSDATEEDELQFEQLQQLIHQRVSKGSIKGYTRTLSGNSGAGEWKFDTLLITFKDTGALWRQTKRKNKSAALTW